MHSKVTARTRAHVARFCDVARGGTFDHFLFGMADGCLTIVCCGEELKVSYHKCALICGKFRDIQAGPRLCPGNRYEIPFRVPREHLEIFINYIKQRVKNKDLQKDVITKENYASLVALAEELDCEHLKEDLSLFKSSWSERVDEMMTELIESGEDERVRVLEDELSDDVDVLLERIEDLRFRDLSVKSLWNILSKSQGKGCHINSTELCRYILCHPSYSPLLEFVSLSEVPARMALQVIEGDNTQDWVSPKTFFPFMSEVLQDVEVVKQELENSKAKIDSLERKSAFLEENLKACKEKISFLEDKSSLLERESENSKNKIETSKRETLALLEENLGRTVETFNRDVLTLQESSRVFEGRLEDLKRENEQKHAEILEKTSAPLAPFFELFSGLEEKLHAVEEKLVLSEQRNDLLEKQSKLLQQELETVKGNVSDLGRQSTALQDDLKASDNRNKETLQKAQEDFRAISIENTALKEQLTKVNPRFCDVLAGQHRPRHGTSVISWLRSREWNEERKHVVIRQPRDVYDLLDPDNPSEYTSFNTPGSWIEIKFWTPIRINGFRITTTSKSQGFPRTFNVIFSNFGKGLDKRFQFVDEDRLNGPSLSLTQSIDVISAQIIRIGLQGQNWLGTFSLELGGFELFSPDEQYREGVFKSIFARNRENVYDIFDVSARDFDWKELHNRCTKSICTLGGTNGQWFEVGLAHGKLAVTGYRIRKHKDFLRSWSLRGSNDRNAPLETWAVIHKHCESVKTDKELQFECSSAIPFKFFRIVQERETWKPFHWVSVDYFDFDGVFIPD